MPKAYDSVRRSQVVKADIEGQVGLPLCALARLEGVIMPKQSPSRTNDPSPREETGPVRLFFHLKSKHQAIPDDAGVKVVDLQDARTQVLRAIEDLREQNVQDWSGWTLVAVDETGTVVFTVSLDTVF